MWRLARFRSVTSSDAERATMAEETAGRMRGAMETAVDNAERATEGMQRATAGMMRPTARK